MRAYQEGRRNQSVAGLENGLKADATGDRPQCRLKTRLHATGTAVTKRFVRKEMHPAIQQRSRDPTPPATNRSGPLSMLPLYVCRRAAVLLEIQIGGAIDCVRAAQLARSETAKTGSNRNEQRKGHLPIARDDEHYTP